MKIKECVIRKKVPETCQDKTFASPTTLVYNSRSEITKKNWKVSYVNSKQTLFTEHGMFHFELVLEGFTVQEQSQVGKSISHVKFCPVVVDYKGAIYDFFVNPVDKVSVCVRKPKVLVPWKEGIFNNTVVNLEELTPDEQFQKHKVLLENYIEEEYIKEIYTLLSNVV